MKHLSRAAALLLALTAASAPIAAFAEDAPAAGAASSTDVVPMAVWTIASVLVMGVVATVFYLFKRRIGGFPSNPIWKAPITIMPSKDFADEGTFGDAPADGHGPHH